MSEMVGPELGLEAIDGVTERWRHHTGIGDHQVEGLVFRVETIGAGANTGE